VPPESGSRKAPA